MAVSYFRLFCSPSLAWRLVGDLRLNNLVDAAEDVTKSTTGEECVAVGLT